MYLAFPSLVLSVPDIHRMNISPVQLEVSSGPLFPKMHIIPFGPCGTVRQAIQTTCKKGLITSVESLKLATHIVTPLKADGKTRRIYCDYRLTLNKKVLQLTCYRITRRQSLSNS